MKRRTVFSSLLACALTLVWCASAGPLSAQDKAAPQTKTKAASKTGASQSKGGQNVSDKAQQSRGNPQEDPNVQTRKAPNDASKAKPAPSNKTSQATRGAGICVVHVDNRTPWVIDVYVDREYAGTVGSWGDIYPLAGSGATRFYAHADFTDGSTRTWGPRMFQCDPGSVFTWTLNP